MLGDPRNRDSAATRIGPLAEYAGRTWATSNVVPFPAAINRPAVADIAAAIVLGKRKGGLAAALREHGRMLYRAHVPLPLARADLDHFEAELSALIEIVRMVREERNGQA